MIGFRIGAAALALALAATTFAQEGGGTLSERMRRARDRKASQTPAPAPQAQAPAGQQGQQGPLTEEQRAALGAVHAQNELAARIGELAASRGNSQQVKDLGRMLAQDHRRLDGELATLVKARGVELKSLPAAQDHPRLDAQASGLSGKSGEDFDREFVSFLTQNGTAFVDALKRARDVTPGKDAQLKKFLDDAENVEEGHLAASRQAKQQRQARTPPAR